MKAYLAAIALVLAGGTASAQSVEVGTARWDRFPALQAKPSRLDHAALATTVEALLKNKQCTFAHQSARRFDISVPYAVQFDDGGKVSRVLVANMGCTPLETLVGHAVLAQADAGDFLPGSGGAGRWYAGSLNFNLQ
ncbi:hypothetical protein [Sphingomonas sp.]|uniref:hypothetical protein n=1 Tax=Sphingomonas sp. TaxID=28214 RepID=UPI002C28A616|nr:hypothetical protein [Sphingomonas sp.]HWK37080.1 hypothetical protein [Sphingomonas sp.]